MAISGTRPSASAPRLEGDGRSLGLELVGVSVRFGGVRALDEVDIVAPVGRITGLIGPNGAGKTTLFNVSCGSVRPSAGEVRLHGQVLSPHLGAPARARLGIGRTFQQPRLFDSMTVGETIALGREAALAGRSPLGQVLPHRGDPREIRESVEWSVDVTGIAPLLDRSAGSLATGERRLVELARCLAAPFQLLLLDEPSAGLDREETAKVVAVIRRLAAERGLGVLLVEHDMAVVLGLCDQVHVLDFGRKVFSGSAEQVRTSELVRDAYLGVGLAAADS